MTQSKALQRGISKTGTALVLAILVFLFGFVFYGRLVRRTVRETLMQKVTSAHYEIVSSPGALSKEAMTQFASQRESIFASLDRTLGNTGSNAKIRIIFETDDLIPAGTAGIPQPYNVSGTTIRTKSTGSVPQLDPAADAEVLLQIAWGKPGNPRIGRWTAICLAGERDGQELGMAATQVEQRLGHQKLTTLLEQRPGGKFSANDLAVLGGAWIIQIEELGGPAEVRKLYSAKMTNLDATEVASTLNTNPMELERKWQMWMYANLAGMPATTQGSDMPMNMAMPDGH